MEAGESPGQAAEREALEETGYLVQIDPAAQATVKYPFRWAGKEYDCTTHFFLARLSDPKGQPEPRTPQDVEFLVSVEWIPVKEIPSAFAHHPLLAQTISSLVSPRH